MIIYIYVYILDMEIVIVHEIDDEILIINDVLKTETPDYYTVQFDEKGRKSINLGLFWQAQPEEEDHGLCEHGSQRICQDWSMRKEVDECVQVS